MPGKRTERRSTNLLFIAMFLASLALHSLLFVIFESKKVDDIQQAKGVRIQLLVQASAELPATTLPSQNVHHQNSERPTPADPLIIRHVHPLPILKKADAYKKKLPVTKDDITQPTVVLQPHLVKTETGQITRQEKVEKLTEAAASAATAQTADQVQDRTNKPLDDASVIGGMDEYMQTVLRRIERRKHYPLQARMRHLEGRTVIGFNLLANGNIDQPKVVGPSGHALLDQSALQAVTSAAPFGKPPEKFPGIAIPLEVVLVFQLQQGFL